MPQALHGKLANTFADLKSDKLTTTGNFKMLVSGDFIRAQKKFCDPFEFQNYAKLFFSANEVPQSEDKTYAYFRRWIIFFFEKVFEGENNNNDIHLIDKLTTWTELSGLLNLALIALRQLIKDNGFIHTDDIATIEREYNPNASTVQRLLIANTILHMIERTILSVEIFGVITWHFVRKVRSVQKMTISLEWN
jgi:putative DNA primase/helicase